MVVVSTDGRVLERGGPMKLSLRRSGRKPTSWKHDDMPVSWIVLAHFPGNPNDITVYWALRHDSRFWWRMEDV